MHFDAELFHRAPTQPPAHRGGLALSDQQRVQPGRRPAQRRHGPALPGRGPARHLPPDRRPQQGRSHRLGRGRQAADRRRPDRPAQLLGSRGSAGHLRRRARRLRDRLHRVRARRAVRGARPHRGLPARRAARRGHAARGQERLAAAPPHRRQYVLFHRPVSVRRRPRRRVAVEVGRPAGRGRTPEPVMQSRSGPWWDATRIGMGPPPIETPHGWLCVTTASSRWWRRRCTASA